VDFNDITVLKVDKVNDLSLMLTEVYVGDEKMKIKSEIVVFDPGYFGIYLPENDFKEVSK
jgi:hypothetical protein